jgi:hypothetical protein
MAERQLPKLHTGVRFPSPAHLPMKTGAENAGLKAKIRTEIQTSSILVVRFSISRRLPKNISATRLLLIDGRP